MSDIKGQLIKNTYNYVLQSDLISGIVYRIGGSVAENPKFISGLTVNANFTYSDGTEFPGYVLTCDATGNAVWGPVSGATSGVVVTGGTFDYSAGTLTLVLSNGVNVPISGLEDIYVTGGVVSGNSIVFSYNDTNTFEVSGITPYNLFSSYTASTQVTINNKLDTSGFTAYTATTQPLILNSVTGGTYSNGTLNLINNSGATIPITGFTTGGSSTTDSYVTGFTLDNETITLSQNRIDQYSAFSVSLSGYVTNNIFSSYTASTQSTINNKLDTSGFTSYTATTQPLILNSVTGGTFSGGTLYLINNSGSTIPISGFTTGGTSTTDTFVTGFTLSANTITLSQNRIDSYSSFTISLSAYTGSSVSGEYLPLSGGTVSGATNFTNGLTANTISATTYYNLPISAVTNGTGISASTSNGTVTIINTAPEQTVLISGGTNIQITGSYPSFGVNFTGNTSSTGNYLPLSGGTVTGATNFTSGLTANTISATTYQNLPSFTGGTVSGATRFTGGLTANTISATTYQNLPAFTGGTVSGTTNFTNGLIANTISSSGKLAVNVSTVTDGVNSYSVYASLSPGEYDYMTNGIGGYFAVDARNGYVPNNKYSLQLIDETEGVGKVLTCVTSDGKANWSGTLNVSAVTATTITSNSVKVLPVALTVISNTASTDASLSSTFTLTLTGNTTLATPTNGFSGQRIVYRLRQDGTGSKLLTLSSGFRSGPITVTLSTAANTTDYLGVIYNEIDNEWDVLALNKGYS